MVLRLIGRLILSMGCDPRRVVTALRRWPSFLKDAVSYARLHRKEGGGETFRLRLLDLSPMLHDKTEQAGNLGVYFHQDLYVARAVFRCRPPRHVDIGSRIDGFLAHLLVFMDVEMVDVRPLFGVEGFTTTIDDGRLLSSFADDSIPSLSCLHALEHFRLGRYGDEIDALGWRKGLAAMGRVLAPGGRFYLSVPVGRERVEYNSQRIFHPATILGGASALSLVDCVLISGDGTFQPLGGEAKRIADHHQLEKKVAIFVFTKTTMNEDVQAQ